MTNREYKAESVIMFSDTIEKKIFFLYLEKKLTRSIATDCSAFYIFLKNLGYKNFEIARGDNSEVSLAFTDNDKAQFFELIFQSDGSYILTVERTIGEEEYLEHLATEDLVIKLSKPYKVWSNSSEQYADPISSKPKRGSAIYALSAQPNPAAVYQYFPMNVQSKKQAQFVTI